MRRQNAMVAASHNRRVYLVGLTAAARLDSANFYLRAGWSSVIELSWLHWDAHRHETTYRMNRRQLANPQDIVDLKRVRPHRGGHQNCRARVSGIMECARRE